MLSVVVGYSKKDTARLAGGAPAARTPFAVLALLLCILVAALAAPAARAVELGISDSNADTTVEPYWDGLGMRSARVVLPWDVATTRGDAGTRRREDFDRHLANANAKGVGTFVVFGPSADVRAPITGDALAPSAAEYAAGVAAFLERYPGVRTLGAWNEPNNPDGRQYPLAADPALAAQYWLILQGACPTCTVVAGEFAGIAGDDGYTDAYLAALGGARPAVWGIHAHGDVNSFQVDGPDSARVVRYYLGKLQGDWAGSRVWLTEVGARFRDPEGAVWGDASQARATQFLLGLALLDPRIDWIYYYNYSNECSTAGRCAVQDRGLVSPNPWDGSGLGYDGSNRRRPAWDVVAARGPAIRPAELVPPAVTIATPAQSAAVATATPTFSGGAAVGGRAEPALTLQVFPGVSATESGTPVQTLSAPVGADGAWSVASAPLADGPYTARATQVGNRSGAGVSQDTVFTIDTVAPTATIGTRPDAVTGKRTATFTFEASEAGATFRCSVDRAPYAECGATLRLRDLPPGRHSLRVRAVDAAGNVQPSPTIRTWTVVSLATALVPRTADLGEALTRGLPLAASCADACRVDARLYMPAAAARAAGLAAKGVSRSDPARPSGRGYVKVAGAKVVRRGAGSPVLALRLRASSQAALAATPAVTVRVGFVLRPERSRPLAVSRRVTLVRSGALRALAEDGLPVAVACTSVCTQRLGLWASASLARSLRARGGAVSGSRGNGLPRGRYVALGSGVVTRRRAFVVDTALRVPPSVRRRLVRRGDAGLRVVTRANGPGTAVRTLGWPLTLPR